MYGTTAKIRIQGGCEEEDRCAGGSFAGWSQLDRPAMRARTEQRLAAGEGPDALDGSARTIRDLPGEEGAATHHSGKAARAPLGVWAQSSVTLVSAG